MQYYLPPGRRADASNGNLEGNLMPFRYNRGGITEDFLDVEEEGVQEGVIVDGGGNGHFP